MAKFRDAIMRGIWSRRSKMRCLEILYSLLFDPTKLDPYFAAICRSFYVARRMLRKNLPRYEDFMKHMRLAEPPYKSITGPVHGFMSAVSTLGIKATLDKGFVNLHSPRGYSVELTTPNKTLFNSFIKDAVSHAILHHLEQRVEWEDKDNTPKPKNFRKDMQGVDVHLDLRASRALLNKYRHLPKELKRDTIHSDPLEWHTLLTILSGSIRAPDRLHAAKMAETDVCNHPECNGARCTTEHIFWDCAHHTEIRNKYLTHLKEYIKKVNTKTPHLIPDLEASMTQACFRFCGLLPRRLQNAGRLQ